MNPHATFTPTGTKEYQENVKSAVLLWKPQKLHGLNPEDSDDFVKEVTRTSKEFAYHGLLKRVPTTKTTAPDGTVTFGDHKNILTTYEAISDTVIQSNATECWGNKSWSRTDDKQIVALTAARGEMTPNGRNFTDTGKQLMVNRYRMMILGA